MLLGGLARRHGLFGIIVFELVEREGNARGKADCFDDGVRRIGEQPLHFFRRFQVALGIGLEQAARALQRLVLADAGDDVLQRAAFGCVIEDVVDGDERCVRFLRHALKFFQTPLVVAGKGKRRGEPEAIGRCLFQPRERGLRFLARFCGRQDDEQLAILPGEQIVEMQRAVAFFGAEFSNREQAAEAAIGGAIGRIDEDVRRAVLEDKARADQKLRALRFLDEILERRIGADHAGERVAVGDADGGEPELDRGERELFWPRRPAQEGEIRRDGDLGIGHRLRLAHPFVLVVFEFGEGARDESTAP